MKKIIPSSIWILNFAALVCLYAGAEEVRLPITADNSICCYPGEQEINMGDASRIKMKGIENLIILNADTAPLKDKVVTKATLHIRGTDKNMMVRKAGFSTIATAWKEGQAGGDGHAKPGSSNFKSPETGSSQLWGGPGSCFLDALWGRSGTIWTQSYVEPGKDEWYAMEFDGRLLEACAAGISYGIALSDDNGQTSNIHKDVMATQKGNFSNNFFYAREQHNSAPYFTVETAPAKTDKPAALAVTIKAWQAGADFEHGGAEIDWPGPKDAAEQKETIGYRIFTGTEMKELPRWQHPAPVLVSEVARALLQQQSPNVELKVKVQVLGRGGAVLAEGEATGKSSPAFPVPLKLLESAPPSQKTETKPAPAPAVWVVPDCVKVNPITGNVQEEAHVDYEGEPAGTYSQSNAVWNAEQKRVTLNAIRGEWIAFQIVCQNSGNEPTEWTIKTETLKGQIGPTIPEFKLSRLWYQKAGKSGRGWYADPMIPLTGPFTVPLVDNGISEQKNQTIYVECYVPPRVSPAEYVANLTVTSNKGASSVLQVVVNVAEPVMSEAAHFVWSMNAYSAPGDEFGAPGSATFVQAERHFYATAHDHRTTLAVLHYSHGGTYQTNAAPPLTGTGTDMKCDFTQWDKRFGPLFDGRAFKETTRENAPLDHFYLVLAEHYPTKMADGYKWNNLTWEEHWKGAGPVEEGFSEQYKQQWTAVAADFVSHIKEKGWKTQFQVYLNDKYFYKQYQPKKKQGEGVSFWLLDEPQHIDDFSALAFFGKLLRPAQNGDRSSLLFRVDVSRPQWGRDLLDRVVDLNVSGGFSEYRPWLEDWRERYGQRVWTYGGAPSSMKSALSIEAQALDLYSRGVDGFVPWLVLGNAGNWRKFEDTCVFYPGKQFGVVGACPSLRLKAFRRGEQDVEYVWLLARKLNLLEGDPNRRQIGALLNSAIHATKTRGTLDAQGAVTESISGVQYEDFEQLRQAIVQKLKN